MPTLRGFSLLSTPFSGVRWPIVAHLAEFQPSLGPHGHHNRPLFGRNWRDTDSCLVKKSLLVWSGALLLLCTSFRRQVQGTTLFFWRSSTMGKDVSIVPRRLGPGNKYPPRGSNLGLIHLQLRLSTTRPRYYRFGPVKTNNLCGGVLKRNLSQEK